MVLPPCRYPSASWRSRVLPACRSAGHSNCRARAFRTPLPGGGSGRNPRPFAGFRRAPLDKAPRTMVRYRQSAGERVGRERRLLYGLYDGSDGGDCGDGNGKDDTHDRVHEDDEGATHAHLFTALPHQFAANPHGMPRTQGEVAGKSVRFSPAQPPVLGRRQDAPCAAKSAASTKSDGILPRPTFLFERKSGENKHKTAPKVAQPSVQGLQTFCRAAAKKTTLAAG